MSRETLAHRLQYRINACKRTLKLRGARRARAVQRQIVSLERQLHALQPPKGEK